VMQKYAQRDQAQLEYIYTQYVVRSDSDGLSKAEVEPLIFDSIMALRRWLPRMHMQMNAANLNSMRNKHESDQRAILSDRMADMVMMIEQHTEEILDERLHNMKETVDSIYNLMDVDGDGGVTKEEFLETFSGAQSTVLNPEDMMRELNYLLYHEDDSRSTRRLKRRATFRQQQQSCLGRCWLTITRAKPPEDSETDEDDDDDEMISL
jgi:hypothetical protein